MPPHPDPAATQLLRPASLGAGPVLALVPRLADAVAGPGATLALHAALGDPVEVVDVFGPPALGEVERAAAAALGVGRLESWGLAEQGAAEPRGESELARRLARLLVERRPASLYAPWSGEPDVLARVLSRVTALAVALADFEGPASGYELRAALTPTRTLEVGTTWPTKRAALLHCAPELARALEGLAAFRGLALRPTAEFAEAFAPLADLRIPVPRGSTQATVARA